MDLITEETSAPTAYRVVVAINQAADELRSAMDRFPPMASAHEGYAVILEELDEMWQEVKHGTPDRAREEAVQVAAMALRFLVDIDVDRERPAAGCDDCAVFPGECDTHAPATTPTDVPSGCLDLSCTRDH